MLISARRLALCFITTLTLTALAAPARAEPPWTYPNPLTALEDYVAAPDKAYGYGLVDSFREDDDYTVYLLRMTSQRWPRTGTAYPRLWAHWLMVVVPDNLAHDTAALLVSGGSDDGRAPDLLEEDEARVGAQLAALSQSVVAVLMQVPYQPVMFPDEPWPHKEDELVAYSWNKAIETGDYSWPAYVPMTKAVVRAMDAIQDFVPQVAGRGIADFVVMGGSKRGAETWLAAVADARVKAIAPAVIDILNFSAQMEHHLAVYGTYAPAIHDYVDYNLVQRVDTPEGEALRQVVDPYTYLDALDMPKYIINSSGDQFFPPDSTQFYFDDLPGENLLRVVPNSDHSLSNTSASLLDMATGLFGWYLTVVEDAERPEVDWLLEGDTLVVEASPAPLAARLWQATNPGARDFRLAAIGEAWQNREIDPVAPGRYAVTLGPPISGWTASFVELAFPSPQPGICQVYSTRVYVTPDVRPFEGMTPEMVPNLASNAAPASAFDDLVASVGDDLHEEVLDRATNDGSELSERALRYCFVDEVDDLDDIFEVYVRVATGESVDNVVDTRLQDLIDGADGVADDLVDGAGDGIDDAVDAVGDAIDKVF